MVHINTADVMLKKTTIYEQDQKWQAKAVSVAADRYTLQTPNQMLIGIGGQYYLLEAQLNLDLSVAGNWDTQTPTDYTVAANRAGKQFYAYACQQSGSSPEIILSAASTYPSGYTADNSRKVATFHCLCVAVGTIGGHTLTDYVAGDILPQSVADLNNRRMGVNGPAWTEGMVLSAKTNKWVDIYLASGTGTNTSSVYGATISDTRDWLSFVDDGGAVGKRLSTDTEFQLMAAGSNEATNITGSADPVTAGGHSDTAARRMISNVGCEDMAGAMWQWLQDQSYRFDNDFNMANAAGKTLTITHDAAPGGNPVYLKFGDEGIPYLCCNLATTAVDKVLTFGSAYTLIIKHDANAAVGSYQIYFDEDATQPARLLAALPGLKTCHLRSSNPEAWLQVAYNAAPGTPGVAVNFDDGADQRLEFTSPTTTNGTLDLACFMPAWGWYSLPGSKGQLYRQGAYGDAKLRAGGGWSAGSYCGSRSRAASYYRWNTSTNIGGRFVAEPYIKN